MKRRLVMAAAAAALVPRSGSAQSPASGAFPDRPVRFVVPCRHLAWAANTNNSSIAAYGYGAPAPAYGYGYDYGY